MEQEYNAKSSQLALDDLAALNIVPFLGLMNMVEVKYLHMPEVYRTMLAILCDYNPHIQDNIMRTRRYLSVLLAREPDLAQCLLNFIDMPQGHTQTSTKSSTTDGWQQVSDSSKVLECQSLGAQQGLNTLSSVNKSDEEVHQDIPSSQYKVKQEQTSDSCRPHNNLDSFSCNSCSKSIFSSSTAHQHANCTMNILQTDIPKDMSLQLPSRNFSSGPQKSQDYGDRTSHYVPVINIHHRGLFTSEAAVASTSTASQQTSPLFLPHFLASHVTPTVSADLEQATKPPDTGNCMTLPEVQREEVVTGSASQTLNSYLQQKTPCADLSTCVAGHSNINKSNRQCKVAQTQTLSGDTRGIKNFHNIGIAKEIPTSVKISRDTTTIQGSSTKMLMTIATSASQSSPVNPPVCLSKLLGQPSVAYLPAGHYIDNRNCIVGGSKSVPAEKQLDNTTALQNKVTNAAAKLHLLSTQARSEKTGSVQVDCEKSGATVTSKLAQLSAKTQVNQQDIRTKTALKLSANSGRCNKLIAFSKFLPVLKPSVTSKISEQTKLGTVSLDKEIQVGNRDILTASSAKTDQKEQISQLEGKQNTLQPKAKQSTCQKLSLCKQAEETLPRSQQKKSSVLQQTDLNLLQNCHENTELSSNQNAHKKLPMNQKIGKFRKARNQENYPNIETHVKENEKSPSCQLKRRKTENLTPNLQKGQKQLENHSKSLETQKISRSQSLSECTTVSSDRLKQQTGKPLCIKAAEKSQMKIVEVSVGATPSLSAFPYIQQMVLPDGRVSTIAHNSPLAQTESASQQTHTSSIQQKDFTTVSYHTKTLRNMADSCQIQDEQVPFSKDASQTALLQNQVKLSVSIQTPCAQLIETSSTKQKQSASHLSNPQCLKNYTMMTTNTLLSSSASNREEQQATSIGTAYEKDGMPSTRNLHAKGKRRRSPSSMKTSGSKHSKL